MPKNLNEKFEELVNEAEGQHVGINALSPAIVPSQSSGHEYIHPVSNQSVTAVNAKAGKQDPGFKLPTSIVPDQSEDDDDGSSLEHPQGVDNPGAKSASHISKVRDAQTRSNHQDPMPSLKSSGYGLEKGPVDTKVFGMESIKYSADEDVAALTEGGDFSEEFKSKAATIFEAAVKSRIEENVKTIFLKLEENFTARIEEEFTALAEKVDETLNYAINVWVEENQIAMDAGLKLEIAEEFMGNLKKVFEENHIELPADKIDAVETMTEELCEMEEKLNEQIERNIELHNKLSGYQKTVILNKMSEGLVDTQKEKLTSLAESVEFISEEDFKNKVATLIGSYFPKHVISNNFTEESPMTNMTNEEYTPAMSAYLQALARWQ